VVGWDYLRLEGRLVDRIVPRLGEVDLVVQRLMLQVRQDQSAPTMQRLAVGIDGIRWRERAVFISVHVQRQSDLLEVIRTLRAPRGFSGDTHGGK
jgi:hypothetical protein